MKVKSLNLQRIFAVRDALTSQDETPAYGISFGSSSNVRKIPWSRSIRTLLAVYVLAIVFPNTAFAVGACQAVFSEEASGARSMRDQGIANAERIPGLFEILPDGEHPLNALAARIKAVYGGVLVYFPRALRESGATAFAGSFPQPDGTRVPALFLAHRSLYNSRRPLRDIMNLHELRHLRFDLDLQARKPSPFHGDMRAVEGQIPDRIFPDSPAYRGRMGFEELKTYSDQMKHTLLILSAALKKDARSVETREAIVDLVGTASALVLLSNRVELVTESLLSLLAKDSARVRFEEHDGLVHAVVKDLTVDAAVLEIAIPLVEARSVSDANLPTLLEKQVRWLRAAALERRELHGLLKSFRDYLLDPNAQTAAKLRGVEIVQQMIFKLRATEKSPR